MSLTCQIMSEISSEDWKSGKCFIGSSLQEDKGIYIGSEVNVTLIIVKCSESVFI